MESERDEELRVLFAAAEKGRADIINTVVEALAAKPKAAAGRGATASATATAVPVSPEEAYADRRKLLSSLRESDGASALHVASMNGHVDAARALLRLGAAPEVKGTGTLRGLTAWDVAPTTVKQAYANDLFSQVACGEKSRAMALLKAGVRPNVTDGGPSADTPLHWAASFGHADLCSLLLNEGADVNRCNNEGTTPLHEACKGGHGDVVRLLLEQGADPQIAATGGAFKDKTPLEMSCSEAVSDIFRAPMLHPAAQVLLGDGSSDGSNAAVGRTRGSSAGAPQRLAVPPPPPPRSVQTSHIGGVSNRRHSSIDDSDIVGDSSAQALSPCPASGGGGGGGGGGADGGTNSGAGPSGPGGHSGTSRAGGPGGVSWAPSLRNNLGHGESAGVSGSGSGSGHHGVSNGGAEGNGEGGARGIDRERPAPRPGGGFDGVDGHGGGGGGGGLGVEEGGKGEDQGRALPMLWPPPRACTVLRDEICLVPSQIVVVLPAGGVAGPGTLTLRTLLAAFASHGVEARCTRGRCPPGSGKEFFVALSCVTSWAKGGGGGGQGFSLVAGPGMVRVSGTGEPGLLYGVRTLCQILSIYASRPAKESALRIPCCIIRDQPDVSRRSLIVDVRYPLVPTLPSLMRTVEVASRARMNVVQLTVARETASWLAGQEQHAANKTAGSSEGGFSARTVGRDVGDDREEGVWGWGSLGELEAFCREHFVELVLGWAVVAGDESRDAQRTTLQLLSSLSRQFQSDEIHITFDQNVRLEWEGGCTTINSSDGPHRDGPPGPVVSQNAGNVGGNPSTGARGGTQRSLNGTGVGAAEHDGRQAGGDSAGGDGGPPGGVLPRLSPLSSEAGRTPALSSGTSAVAAREEGLLLLTRFLSNVVVACGQGTIVLDGVPPAAIASLQGAGYLPVDLAFSLGGEALSDHRALGLLSGDGVIDGRSDELSMLLGPAYLGYVCTGHWGCIGGRREEACLSIHGALVDVARGVSAARRVGCGVQVRPRAVLLPTPPAAPRGHATASSSAATTTTTAATIPGCSGANPYYPALLSDALTFLGGGLSWGLKKASAAVNLSPPSDVGAEEGSGVAGGIVSEEASRGAAGGGGARGDPAVEASLLQGNPSAALLLMTHLLRIGVEELETASAMQLCRCLEMLLEEWSPFSAAGGSRGPHYDEEVAIVRKMDAVLWGVHAPGGDGSLRFCVNGNNRFLLRSLQRRHLELQQVSKLAIQGLQASNAPCAGATRSWLMEVLRTARLLKLSGRFLQTICLHVRGPSPGFSIEHTPGDDHPPSPVVLSSPASGPRRNSVPIHRRNSSENMPHFNWNSGCSEGVGGNESGDEWTLQELVARLPVTVRLDVANRYLEEFRDLARAWNSAAYLPSGRALLHASLSGTMEILAHDTPAAQMHELCKSAIYNS